MAHRICFIGGDGIGPELVAHARRVIDALDVEVTGAIRQGERPCLTRQWRP